LPIPGDVSFVLEEYRKMRELTEIERDAVAGGSYGVTIIPVFVGNGSVGSHSNNTGIQSGGVGNFNGANVTNISGNISVSSGQEEK
jgi:hypothetical protein